MNCQPSIDDSSNLRKDAFAGRSPGGRPLRRRRGKWCQFTAGNGSEGPQAREDRRQNSEPQTSNPKPQNLQAATDHRCRDRMAVAGRSPGGVRSVGAVRGVSIYGRQRLRGSPSPAKAVFRPRRREKKPGITESARVSKTVKEQNQLQMSQVFSVSGH
jgi:hypothetical protein